MNSILKTSLLFLAIGSFQAISCSDTKAQLRATPTENKDTQKPAVTEKSPQDAATRLKNKEALRKQKALEYRKKSDLAFDGIAYGSLGGLAAFFALLFTKKYEYINFCHINNTSGMMIATSMITYLIAGGLLGTFVAKVADVVIDDVAGGTTGGYIGSSAAGYLHAPDNDEDNDSDDKSTKKSTQETALEENN